MSGDMRFAYVPRDPLEPHLSKVKSRARRRGVQSTTPAALARSSVRAILLCDLRPRAARALTSRRTNVSGRVPSRVDSQSQTNAFDNPL